MPSHSRGRGFRLLCVAVLFGSAVAAAPAHAGGPSSAGVAIGFARVRLSDGVVSAFGGKGTKNADTGPTGTGVIVFFDGRYPKNLTRDQVIVQATAEADEAGQHAVANAIVASASSDQIVVTVNAWESNSLDPVDGYVFLTVFAGVVPQVD